MKFIFIDNNEDELDIIENILSSWDIKYQIEENNFYFAMGYISTYNVHVDMEPDFYLYIKDTIDKEINRLEEKYQLIEYLDKCYFMEKDKRKNKISNSLTFILNQDEISDIMIVKNKSKNTKDSDD